jgi:hypothetical protein
MVLRVRSYRRCLARTQELLDTLLPLTDHASSTQDVVDLGTDGPRKSGRGGRDAMAMKRLLAGAVCAAALVVVPASAAFAGEVKGPPGVPDNTNETGALDHANSACAASGLNDLDSEEGQNVSQVQTAADSWKFYGLPKGSPGTLGLCRGGTGQR